MELVFDDSDFQRGVERLERIVEQASIQALGKIADELLRLSQLEVPFKTGHLSQTGNSERDGEGYVVSYNTPYAARVHEHPEFRFGRGRKGKYLEDPMKLNLNIFKDFFDEEMTKAVF